MEERLRSGETMPKVTELLRDKAGPQTQGVWFQIHFTLLSDYDRHYQLTLFLSLVWVFK